MDEGARRGIKEGLDGEVSAMERRSPGSWKMLAMEWYFPSPLSEAINPTKSVEPITFCLLALLCSTTSENRA